MSNQSGQKTVVDRLVEEHGCRRIAYVRGPSYSEEASERFEGYVEALAAPVLSQNVDLLLPSYPRHQLDGLINSDLNGCAESARFRTGLRPHGFAAHDDQLFERVFFDVSEQIENFVVHSVGFRKEFLTL